MENMTHTDVNMKEIYYLHHRKPEVEWSPGIYDQGPYCTILCFFLL